LLAVLQTLVSEELFGCTMLAQSSGWPAQSVIRYQGSQKKEGIYIQVVALIDGLIVFFLTFYITGLGTTRPRRCSIAW
jgi:hypothetical protein